MMNQPQIKFGTDGWLAVIVEDFTFANLDRDPRSIVCLATSPGTK